MKTRMKMQKKTKAERINSSRPRPVVRLRATTFEDRTKYKRSREKRKFQKEMDL